MLESRILSTVTFHRPSLSLVVQVATLYQCCCSSRPSGTVSSPAQPQPHNNTLADLLYSARGLLLQGHVLHKRILLQDDSIQETGTAATAAPSTTPLDGSIAVIAASAAAPASSPYAPDAPDASVGEALPPVTASDADLRSSSSQANRPPIILTVPGNGVGPAAAVMPGMKFPY
jgi:hypothetical protein